uniref:Cell division control protein n=2 Tax=Nothobranchius korthausae TaxID=1143690 RepID=A0A1A8GBY1_9TELE
MPSTRSQARAQPTLTFPRRKSCRAPLKSSKPQRSASQDVLPPPSPPRPVSPRQSPALQPRLPLSPRKRTGDENGCNLHTPQASPPKHKKTSLSSQRKLGFNENSPVAVHQTSDPSSEKPRCPTTTPSTRRPETPTGSPLRGPGGQETPVTQLFAEKSGFQSLKQVLHTSIPEHILSREAEQTSIRSFLQETVLQRRPGSLYISGAPGTGKTACLSCVLKDMKAELSSVLTVLVNCMSLRSAHSIFPLLADKLKVLSGQKGLQKFFTSPGPAVLLVLDEMDQLDSKAQDVLYTLFEWPHLPSSRLCLIGIANALDLTDRILPRLQAGPHQRPLLLNFPPYSRQELAAIVQDRLAQASAEALLDASAVQFCARKVSAVSGDARKALDICRRAVEMAEADGKRRPANLNGETKSMGRVGLPQVVRVLSEVYGDRMTSPSGESEGESFPLQQKLLVCCLLLLTSKGKGKETHLGKLYETYSRVCGQRHVSAVGQGECLTLCSLLESRGIFALKKAKEARLTKVSLKIEEKDVENALKDRTLLGSILSAGLTS